MKYFERIKDDLIRAMLWLLMLLSLVASMRHVAWLFSTIERMDLASGWIAAIGFDFGIFLLTLIAHKYKEGTAQRRFIRAGIYTNAVLSAMANVMYGVEHQVELGRVSGLLWLLIPYVFALALPVMVVFLAEVLSREEENESRAYERDQRRQERQASKVADLRMVEVPQTVTLTGEEQDNLIQHAIAQGVTSHRKIADMTGLDRGRVARAIDRLEQAGAIKKDIRGRIVTEDRDTAMTAE